MGGEEEESRREIITIKTLLLAVKILSSLVFSTRFNADFS